MRIEKWHDMKVRHMQERRQLLIDAIIRANGKLYVASKLTSMPYRCLSKNFIQLVGTPPTRWYREYRSKLQQQE